MLSAGARNIIDAKADIDSRSQILTSVFIRVYLWFQFFISFPVRMGSYKKNERVGRRVHASLAVVLFALSLAAPRIAFAQAAGDGLMREALSADCCRERTRENPERREHESRALMFANLAAELPLIAMDVSPFAPARSGAEFSAFKGERDLPCALPDPCPEPPYCAVVLPAPWRFPSCCGRANIVADTSCPSSHDDLVRHARGPPAMVVV